MEAEIKKNLGGLGYEVIGRQAKLSDVIEIIGGGTPKRSENKYWNGDIPWLSVADFNNDFRYVNDSIEHITELGLQKVVLSY